MKNRKAWIWLILAALMLSLWGCGNQPEPGKHPEFQMPKVLSTVSVKDGAPGQTLYASTEAFSLYIDETAATFSVTDTAGNRWSSVPEGIVNEAANDELLGLIQVHYADKMGNTYELSSMTHSVRTGKTKIMRIENGARIEFSFPDYGFVVPIHITLCRTGVEITVITAQIEETNDLFQLISVDAAPYFHAAPDTEEGYILLPDGSGTLLDWHQVTDPSVEYKQYVYGRDASIVMTEQAAQQQTVRLPVFGILWGDTACTAILTEGASRATLNATAAGKRSNFSNAYAEFIYRDSALVKIEKKNQTVTVIESSHTTIPTQTVRYCLMSGKDLSYVDMAAAYRDYLLNEGGITPSAGTKASPLVIELWGGVMKQQFVMGFPVEQVVPLTTFDDAAGILSQLKDGGVDNILLNYTQWQKDATGAPIQTDLPAENNLGGKRDLANLLALRSDTLSIYLDVNVNRMAASAWGYNMKNDSASSVRRDPAMQYFYAPNTGKADVSSPIFHLKVPKITTTAEKIAESAGKYSVSGLSTTYLGDLLYSDFSKNAITRDISESIWQDSLCILESATGSLLVAGGNAYALPYADLILDAPMTDSGLLLTARAVPFYQIALHGVVDLSVTALNEAQDVQRAFLKAVETGSYLKWRWIARNEDELVETDYNSIISARYENWIDTAIDQYKQAESLLTRVADQTVVSHEILTANGDLVRVVWSDGTEVLVNYGSSDATVGGRTVPAQGFAVKEGA